MLQLGQGEFLYLLTRKPAVGGKTLWTLFKIDPRYHQGKGKIVGHVELPTSANHLTVVPSEETWYIFERGPVGLQQTQKIDSMISIPYSSLATLVKLDACRDLKR